MTEYQIALAYLSALTIVCLVLFSFTYFLPTPDNPNKAKSTYFFRLLLLFVIAAQMASLFIFEYSVIVAILVSNLFTLLIAYALMCAIYSRYDVDMPRYLYPLIVFHVVVFLTGLYSLYQITPLGYWRSVYALLNIGLPFALTMRQCHCQFKKHRIGDRVLYCSLLITIVLYLLYIFCFSVFFRDALFAPITMTFIMLLSFVCILFFGFALSIIYSLVGKLRKELITDRLTGAKNRNYFIDISKQLISLAKRSNTPLSVIACDLDRFKNINDTYGHAAGDKVLVEFSSNIKASLRVEDVFIRIGGEEFIILLPQINLDNALLTAERLRLSTDVLAVKVGSDILNVSASFGVAEVDLIQDIDYSVNNADVALYEAKRSGRNKVVAFKR
ncbi:GGDEF domain-containing protein [Thalassotalea piscium]